MASIICSSCLVRMSVPTQFSSKQQPLLQSQTPLRSSMRAAARSDGKVTREYNESDGKVVSSSGKDKPLYADELPPPPQRKMSKEQQSKLRDEYLGLGGSANKAIPNYFLYIILGISFLAVLSWLSGAV